MQNQRHRTINPSLCGTSLWAMGRVITRASAEQEASYCGRPPYAGQMPEGFLFVGDADESGRRYVRMRLDCPAVPGFWAEVDLSSVLGHGAEPNQDDQLLISREQVTGTLLTAVNVRGGDMRATLEASHNELSVVLTHGGALDFRLVINLLPMLPSFGLTLPFGG